MGEFRIGRKFAQHSYPNSRAASTVPFARNFAAGPEQDQVIPLGVDTPVLWAAIESGAPPGPLVPITRLSTGIIRISGVLTVNTEDLVQVVVRIRGTPPGGPPIILPVPLAENNTIASNSTEAIPFITETPFPPLPFGGPIPPGTTTFEVLLFVTGTGTVRLIPASSTLDLQEVSLATG
jgi:hypothetical protein